MDPFLGRKGRISSRWRRRKPGKVLSRAGRPVCSAPVLPGQDMNEKGSCGSRLVPERLEKNAEKCSGIFVIFYSRIRLNQQVPSREFPGFFRISPIFRDQTVDRNTLDFSVISQPCFHVSHVRLSSLLSPQTRCPLRSRTFGKYSGNMLKSLVLYLTPHSKRTAFSHHFAPRFDALRGIISLCHSVHSIPTLIPRIFISPLSTYT